MKRSKQTKRALTSSVLALVLCFVMLLGTTFAWFTDNASTSVNKVEAGTLKIELQYATEWEEDGSVKTWTDAKDQTLKFEKASGHENEAILWEPGCTYDLPELRIVNKGNLAVKYVVEITGINGDAELNKAIDWTIGDVAQGTEQHLAAGADNEFTISGHMQESAGNTYQGLSIDGVAITVYATQDTVEYDSNNNQYDKNATYDIPWDGTISSVTKGADGKYHITNAAEFAWVMQQSQNTSLASIYTNDKIVLDANIDFGGATITGFSNESVKFGGSFDGQGYTVSNFTIDRSNKEDYAGLFNYYSYGTIENLNIKNATVIGQSKVGALLGSIDDGATVKNCTIDNCTVIANRKVGGAVGYAQGAEVNDITVKNTTVYCGTTEQAYEKDQWGQVIGYKNTGYSESGNVAGDDVVVKTGATPTLVSSATELAAAIPNGGNIILTSDINGATWTSVSVQGGHTGATLVIDGNGHTITGLTKPLLTTNSASGLTVKNLTIKNSEIAYDSAASTSQGGNGAILPSLNGYPVTLENCHLENVTVEDGEDNYCGVGGFIGQHDAANLSITGCTVTNCTISSSSNHAGAIIGHYTSSADKTATIKSCTVTGGSVTGSYAGQIVGCVNGNGTLSITDCTFTGTACPYVVNATVNVN